MLSGIDIFLSVIDNYGDVGFMLELVDTVKRNDWKIGTHRVEKVNIYTDNVDLVSSFCTKNSIIDRVTICPIGSFLSENASDIIFLAFQYPRPEGLVGKKLIFSFDYLSFEKERIAYHELEHIRSNKEQKIIHIVNSPLTGVIHPEQGEISRELFLKKHNLPAELAHKKWIVRFVYDDVPEDSFTLDEDTTVFLLGKNNGQLRTDNSELTTISLPFLSFSDYQSLLDLSDLNIIRGEVSLVRALHSGKPFLWDMYKGKGGWHREESEGFLERMNGYGIGEYYRVLHNRLNTREFPLVIGKLISDTEPFTKIKKEIQGKNILETLEKYIDSFYFSI